MRIAWYPKILTVIDYTHIPGWAYIVLTMVVIMLSIRNNSKIVKAIGYILALIVVDISLGLVLSELALEDVTNYFIISIEHPISLYSKRNRE
jgi:hypothetical protein